MLLYPFSSEKRKPISCPPVETAENVSKKAKVSGSGVAKNNLYSAGNSNLKTDFKERAPIGPFQQRPYRGAGSSVNSRGQFGRGWGIVILTEYSLIFQINIIGLT